MRADEIVLVTAQAGSPPRPPVRASLYTEVTLTVLGLSMDYIQPPSPTPRVRVSLYAEVTLTVLGLSRDYNHPPPHPSVRVSLYVEVTLKVLGTVRSLSRDYNPPPPCQSIPVCQSYSDSPRIIQGLQPPPTPPGRVSLYAKVTLIVPG